MIDDKLLGQIEALKKDLDRVLRDVNRLELLRRQREGFGELTAGGRGVTSVTLRTLLLG